MIRVTKHITENDIERAESLHHIESLNDKNTFLNIRDPYKKSRKVGKATHDPVTKEITEDVA